MPKDEPDDAKKDKPETEKEESGENLANADVGPEGEDTMKNLRTTFAGIFGNMA